MKPVQDRITKIVENEKILNEQSVKDKKVETDRRNAEQRKEQEKLAELKREEASEISANAQRERTNLRQSSAVREMS